MSSVAKVSMPDCKMIGPKLLSTMALVCVNRSRAMQARLGHPTDLVDMSLCTM